MATRDTEIEIDGRTGHRLHTYAEEAPADADIGEIAAAFRRQEDPRGVWDDD